MTQKVVNGANLARRSWRALRENRQLLVFPLLAGMGLLAASALFLATSLGLGVFTGSPDGSDQGRWLSGLVLLFVFYLVAYTIVVFANTALVGTALRLAGGETATVRDGLSIAGARLGRIVLYALISATIGVLASSLARSGRESGNVVVRIVTAIVRSLVQGAWSLAVFFALPVMVAEDLPVIASLKRSLGIFRATWGEDFAGRTTIGGVGCLAYLAILVLTGIVAGIGLSMGLQVLVLAAIGGGCALIAIVALVVGAVNGVFQASLYRYATTGDAGPFIRSEDAAAAFAEDGR